MSHSILAFKERQRFLYSCTQEEKKKLLAELKNKYKKFLHLKTSALLKKNNLEVNLSENELVIFEQDCPAIDFIRIAEIFLERYLYPVWFEEKNFIFLSAISKSEYFSNIKNAAEIHEAFDLSLNKIRCENIIYLIENPRKPFSRHINTDKKFKTDKDADELQLTAINQLEGIIKVIAPAGSGKTKTLVNRILNLLNNGAEESRILAVAFNKKAMLEMKTRLAQCGVTRVAVKTLHSLGYEILRKKLNWKYSENENRKKQKNLLYEIFKAKEYKDIVLTNDKAELLLKIISSIKLELKNHRDRPIYIDDIKIYPDKIFSQYIELQKKFRLLTFDDMIYFSLIYLMTDRGLRLEYGSKYDFILVDEFQDLNLAQLSLIEIIGMQHRNIFVVGDDDQLIYNWCGAKPEYILNFGKLNPLSRLIVLSKNYRSTSNIVTYSKNLISKNKLRTEKEITPARNREKGIFEILLSDNLNEQCQLAAEWILKIKENRKWSDFAVLFRYNIYEVLLAPALKKLNIPHSPINLSRLFKTSVGNLFFAYFNVILNPYEAETQYLRLALKRPTKYLSRFTIDKITCWDDIEFFGSSESIAPYEKIKLYDFRTKVIDLHNFIQNRKIITSKFIDYIAADFELEKYFSAIDYTIADEAGDSIIYEVMSSLANYYPDINEFYKLMSDIITSEEEIYMSTGNEKDFVLLSSIHRTKGNEFDSVVYFNLSSNPEPEETEDERRVTYVGITRAKENILILGKKSVTGPFIREISLNPDFRNYSNEKLLRMKNRYEKQKNSSPEKFHNEDEEFLYLLSQELKYREMFN